MSSSQNKKFFSCRKELQKDRRKPCPYYRNPNPTIMVNQLENDTKKFKKPHK